MEACRSGPKSINVLQPCYLVAVNWWCCFMLVLLPFSLFCSSWMLEKLGCRSLLKSQVFRLLSLFPIPVCTVSLSSWSGFSVQLALSVCTTGAKKLLQLNFMLSRISDMFLLKNQTTKSSAFSSFSFQLLLGCLDARLPWSDCWIISSDRGYNRSNHQPPQFPSLQLVLNRPQFSSFQLFGGPVWWS